ncbi:MAG TPA: isochorismatase family protein [Bacteroidia bacterium]|jgi:nicotinamidase-related amidase|nr:isochorismatase family protein [Bacteroidia bacterium]
MITAIDKNTALVLIDLQKGIVKMDVIHPIKGVLERSALLVEAFRKAGLPIAVVNVIPSGNNLRNENPMTRNMANTIASMADFADITDDIKTQPTDIFVTKRTWNAFYNTPLHDELKKRGVTGIVLAGVATSIGVEGTARAASELGYNISFATDAMTDRVAGAHENSMQVIFPRIGELGTSADIIQKLNTRL